MTKKKKLRNKLTPEQYRIIELEKGLSEARGQVARLLAEHAKSDGVAKDQVHAATRLRRKIAHVRSMVGSILEILDTSVHPED